VLKHVPPLAGEEALYQLMNSVLEAAARDPQVKQTLIKTAVAAEQDLITPLMQWRLNGPPAGNGWYSPTNSADFGTDYLVRTALARSNMYENACEETKYLFTDTDVQGRPLDGNALYAVTFPKGELPPVHGFWSLTLYNEYHFFHPNPLRRYSLGTKNTTLQYNPDGGLTLFAGARSPGRDRETNWLPAPEGHFSLYIRAYWPKEEIINGTWLPPMVEQVR
jgi:hypothetical protein